MWMACSELSLLWIQRDLEVDSVVAWLKMTRVYMGQPELEGGRSVGPLIGSARSVCVSDAILWSNINKKIGRVVSRLQWDSGVCQ